MTKVRTIIPANAKPGQSIIQVTHPKTGKATRVIVPKNAEPGKMVELELPDDGQSGSRSRISPTGRVSTEPDNEVKQHSARRGADAKHAAAPSQMSIKSSGDSKDELRDVSEKTPLIKKPQRSQEKGCCGCC
jgi:hypothetical protein